MQKNHRSALLSGFLLLSILGLSACVGSVADTPNSSDFSQEEIEQSADTTDSSTEFEDRELPYDSQQTDSLEERPARVAQNSSNSASRPTRQVAQKPSAPAKATLKNVKVFFPKSPESAEDFTAVKPVWRTTSSEGVASFAIEQLIAGPTSREKQNGVTTALQLRGNSNCGKDFTLSINQGVARLQFCRDVLSAGIGDDARAQSAIETTLKQFSTIKSVVLLNKNGNCLADASGDNRCLGSVSTQPKLNRNSQLAINGIGPVNIGMTVEQASQAAGIKLVSSNPNPNRICDYYKLAGEPEGVVFMVTNGRIARVEIETDDITTVSGAKIPDTEESVQSLYGGNLQVSRLPYSEDGHFLTFIPKSNRDKNLRLKFVTKGERVNAMLAGKLPEVNYIEGCLDVRPEA
ncbi:MAG: GerMN domain-containing protein [Kastovskya adunca ATA6-11-RM4]|jgi:hypothetical protein|nr:GerMN domain-containing protein [Kastovskya adunca ATA6-11-RM4]